MSSRAVNPPDFPPDVADRDVVDGDVVDGDVVDEGDPVVGLVAADEAGVESSDPLEQAATTARPAPAAPVTSRPRRVMKGEFVMTGTTKIIGVRFSLRPDRTGSTSAAYHSTWGSRRHERDTGERCP
jgi:hypothetical protein